MNDLKIFANEEFGQVRTVMIDGEPWFVGKDIAAALGYENTRDALYKHVDSEDKNTVAIRDGIQGNPNMTVINESGLYSLIFGSKLEGAKRFKRWVTSEVLPTLRKAGHYEISGRSAYDTKATSVGEVVNLIHTAQKAMDRRGCSAEDESKMIAGICTRFGIQMPDIFLDAPGLKDRRKEEGLDADEKLTEYAVQLWEYVVDGTYGLVTEADFRAFCRLHSLNPEKYLEWLHENRHIAHSMEHGVRRYIMGQYVGGREEHGIFLVRKS